MSAIEIYLIIVLISWVIFFVSAYRKTWGTFFGSFFFAVAWPTAHIINYLMWRQSSRCAWCGKENKRDDATIRAHIMECEKHPMRKQMIETETALRNLVYASQYYLRRGSDPYHDDYRLPQAMFEGARVLARLDKDGDK